MTKKKVVVRRPSIDLSNIHMKKVEGNLFGGPEAISSIDMTHESKFNILDSAINKNTLPLNSAPNYSASSLNPNNQSLNASI
jgi:uncharacterized protein YccT (UPF0319 family)